MLGLSFASVDVGDGHARKLDDAAALTANSLEDDSPRSSSSCAVRFEDVLILILLGVGLPTTYDCSRLGIALRLLPKKLVLV